MAYIVLQAGVCVVGSCQILVVEAMSGGRRQKIELTGSPDLHRALELT